MTFPPLHPPTTLATVRSEPPPGPPFGLADLPGLEGPLLAALGLGLLLGAHRHVAPNCRPDQILVIAGRGHRRIQEAGTLQDAMVAEAEAETAGELSRVEAELPLQQARIQSVALQLQADVVAPAEAAYQEALATARADGDAQTEALRALMDSLLAAGPEARTVYLMPRLQPLLALLRQAVPPLQVEELRLIGEGEAGATSLPVLLARLQAATDLDLGRWLRAAPPPA